MAGHSSAYNRWVTHKQAKGIKMVEYHKVEVKRVNEVRNSLMTKGLVVSSVSQRPYLLEDHLGLQIFFLLQFLQYFFIDT